MEWISGIAIGFFLGVLIRTGWIKKKADRQYREFYRHEMLRLEKKYSECMKQNQRLASYLKARKSPFRNKITG